MNSIPLRSQQLLLAGGVVAVILAGFVLTKALEPPPAADTRVASLEEAVALGVVDREVVEELRATGTSEAILHLDTAPIVEALTQRLGRDRVEELIDEMSAVFRANKATIFAGLGDSARIVRDFESLGAAVVAFSSEAALLDVIRSPLVRSVTANIPVPLPPVDEPVVGETAMPPAALEFEGENVVIGVLDTGFDPNMYATKLPASSVLVTREFAVEDNDADDWGHGTKVVSVALSVAPRTTFYVGDVFTRYTRDGEERIGAFPDDSIAGVQWMIDLVEEGVNVRAVNLSLGGGYHPPAICDDGYHFIEALAVGIVPVVSAGNDAFEDDQGNAITTYRPGLGHPACAQGAFSVGAVTYGGCSDGLVDTIAEFSQSSEELDVLAPGKCVMTADGRRNGTSYAAPWVAGYIAILASARPDADPEAIMAALSRTGKPIEDPNSRITRNRVDIQQALAYLLGGEIPAPTPRTDTSTNVVVTPEHLSVGAGLAPGGRYRLDRFGMLNAGYGPATFAFDVSADLVLGKPVPASWFVLDPDSVTLDPGGVTFVAPELRIPADAKPGSYAALIQPRNAAGEAGTATGPGVRVVFSVAERGAVEGLLGLLTNPLVLIVLVLLAVFGGRELLRRRASG